MFNLYVTLFSLFSFENYQVYLLELLRGLKLLSHKLKDWKNVEVKHFSLKKVSNNITSCLPPRYPPFDV